MCVSVCVCVYSPCKLNFPGLKFSANEVWSPMVSNCMGNISSPKHRKRKGGDCPLDRFFPAAASASKVDVPSQIPGVVPKNGQQADGPSSIWTSPGHSSQGSWTRPRCCTWSCCSTCFPHMWVSRTLVFFSSCPAQPHGNSGASGEGKLPRSREELWSSVPLMVSGLRRRMLNNRTHWTKSCTLVYVKV